MNSKLIVFIITIFIFNSSLGFSELIEGQNFSKFEEVLSFKGHNRPPGALVWSPDGKLLASSSGDDIFIWNLTNGRVFKRIHYYYISSMGDLAWSNDGKRLAYDAGRHFEIFDFESEKVVGMFNPSYYVTSLAWSPCNNFIVVTSGDMSHVTIWNISSGTSICRSNPHGYFIRDISFNPNGSYLATCATNGTIKIWNTDSWEVFQTFLGEAQPIGDVFSISWHPNGSYLASCYRSGNISIWDITSGEIVWNKQVYINPLYGHLGWSPDGIYLASTGNLKLNIWDMSTKVSVAEFDSYNECPIAWSPNGMMIATTGKVLYKYPSGDIYPVVVYREPNETREKNDDFLNNNDLYRIAIILLALIVIFIIFRKIKAKNRQVK